jgi:hypothetical protein
MKKKEVLTVMLVVKIMNFIWHPVNLEHKNPTVLGATVTATRRSKGVYNDLATQLKKYTGANVLIYGTDGQFALERGLKVICSINTSVKLRCFTHVESDMKEDLKKISVAAPKSRNIVTSIVGFEQGENDG